MPDSQNNQQEEQKGAIESKIWVAQRRRNNAIRKGLFKQAQWESNELAALYQQLESLNSVEQ